MRPRDVSQRADQRDQRQPERQRHRQRVIWPPGGGAGEQRADSDGGAGVDQVAVPKNSAVAARTRFAGSTWLPNSPGVSAALDRVGLLSPSVASGSRVSSLTPRFEVPLDAAWPFLRVTFLASSLSKVGRLLSSQIWVRFSVGASYEIRWRAAA